MVWDPRDRAAQEVALEVLLHGPLSRTDIARRLNFAPATLTRASSELIAGGLLVESGQIVEGRGRPSTLLDVVAGSHHFLGVKVSVDTLTAVVVNLRGESVTPIRILKHNGDPQEVADGVVGLASDFSNEFVLDGVGIAVGGVVGDDDLIESAPFLKWSAVPLAAMVEDASGLRTACANDLEAYTRAMHWFGEGSGHNSFAVLTLGVGVGYGCVANGAPLLSPDSGVGLVGHWPLDPLGPICSHGHRGCAESMLTTPFIERQAAEALGQHQPWHSLLELHNQHDEAVRTIFARAALAFGKLVAAVANLTAPELVIVGGEGVGLIKATLPTVEAGILQHRDPRASHVPVTIATDSNEEWCRGAAVPALQRFVLNRGYASAS
ncbi:ROK family protein [Microbacterium sp. NPDC077663]|uniref:ROK family protein n=1 Tax=Microbacterium sp. NPDC077663 TaxID=3364189 RepID=UPI0037C8750A